MFSNSNLLIREISRQKMGFLRYLIRLFFLISCLLLLILPNHTNGLSSGKAIYESSYPTSIYSFSKSRIDISTKSTLVQPISRCKSITIKLLSRIPLLVHAGSNSSFSFARHVSKVSLLLR